MNNCSPSTNQDAEKGLEERGQLFNSQVKELSWSGVTVKVKDKGTKADKTIVDDVCGFVKAGEICALVGPSGCGKTTLLNVLANRPTKARSVESKVLVNGRRVSSQAFRRLSCFVEQEDSLLGALTVRETVDIAACMATSSTPRHVRQKQVDSIVAAFGLTDQAGSVIGTTLRRGISGGQKRRVGVASQLVTCPKMLFLDEPTSGIDSTASHEIMSHLRSIARENKLIVVLSIHQPSAKTFALCDSVLLLSGGKTHYFGPTKGVRPYYDSIGEPIRSDDNPCERLLELVNADFGHDKAATEARIEELQTAWTRSPQCRELHEALSAPEASTGGDVELGSVNDGPGRIMLLMTLLRRDLIKSRRDAMAYAYRVAIIAAFGIMADISYTRIDSEQASIKLFASATYFSVIVLNFLSVAYTPAFLEDRSLFKKDQNNGLYGPAEFMVVNTIIGIAYPAVFALTYAVVTFWAMKFGSSATDFFVYLLWLLLLIFASESTIILMAVVFPGFVLVLCCYLLLCSISALSGGFLIPATKLNPLFRYFFYYLSVQTYAFGGLMENMFRHRDFTCGTACQCIYQSALADQCKISGPAVLAQLEIFDTGSLAKNVGLLLAIALACRLLAWLVLKMGR